MSRSQQLTLKQALSKAQKAAKQGKTAAAVEIYKAILKHQPNHPIAKNGLSKLHKDLPQNKSVEAETSNPPQEQINAAVALYQSVEMAKTEQACRELLQQYPKSLIVMNVLGAALSRLGKLEDSVQVFEKAIQLRPDYAEAYYKRGNAIKHLGRPDEAMQN